jgi:hypothetical protein
VNHLCPSIWLAPSESCAPPRFPVTSAMSPQCAFDVELLHGRRIRSVLVHVDDPRLRIGWVEQLLRKNRLAAAASRLALSRRSIVCPVESTARYKYRSCPLFRDIGLIDAIAFINPFQVRPMAPIQFRPVDLDPAPGAAGVDQQTTFECHLGDMRTIGPPKLQHFPQQDFAYAKLVCPTVRRITVQRKLRQREVRRLPVLTVH